MNFDTTIAIWGLALAIVAHALSFLFKSPKEINGELAAEVKAIREDQQEASQQSARHDEILKHLIRAIEQLTIRIDRLEPPPRQAHRRGV